MDGKFLIDKARRLGHSDSETARLIGVHPSYLSRVYSGDKQLSEQTAVLLADLVGEDPDDVLRRITVENEKNPARKAALSRVLFALGTWCVALVPLYAVTGDAQAADVTRYAVYTLCAMHLAHAWAAAAFRSRANSRTPLGAGHAPGAVQ